jgi:hypothetical protein
MRITFYSSLIMLIAAHIILPLVIFIWLWRSKSSSRFTWLIKIIITAPVVFILFLAGDWQQLTYYGRIIVVIVYISAVIRSYCKSKNLPLYARLVYVDWLLILTGLCLTAVMLHTSVNIFQAYSYKGKPVDLDFPFKNGTYLICFGGNGNKSALINYHYKFPLYPRSHPDPSVIYAVDIVKLNDLGKSAKGFMPVDPSRYEIYLDTVYSPCDGIVVSVEDKWPDERPYAFNYPYNPGNSIVIKYKNAYILMGHLEKGSILAKAGDSVKKGQALAKAGNSGWTTEPHLHIQAMRSYDDVDNEGESLPFTFNGRFPVKNDLFIKP